VFFRWHCCTTVTYRDTTIKMIDRVMIYALSTRPAHRLQGGYGVVLVDAERGPGLPVDSQPALVGPVGFQAQGPRSVRTYAWWTGEENRILFYDGQGERFAEATLAAYPRVMLHIK
jgi:hypothetical protein